MGRSHYPHPPHAEPTTHGAAEASESRSDAAGAGPDHHQGLHAEVQTDHHWSHRLYCRHSLRCLHRCHQSLHLRHRSHRRHHLHHLHLLYRCPHYHSPATYTTTTASSTTPATLALAVAALRTSRSSTDVLRKRDICSSSRGEGGRKGGGGAPLKEG
ncbi:unnamed protein product [Closterium sp. NIES-54]